MHAKARVGMGGVLAEAVGDLLKHRAGSCTLTMGMLCVRTRDWVTCSQRSISACRRSFMASMSARL